MWADVIHDVYAGDAWLIFTFDLLAKLTLLLLLGSTAALLMKRQSAATRHWIWMLTLIAAVVTPLGMFLLPGWGIERLVDANQPINMDSLSAIQMADAASHPDSATSRQSSNNALSVASTATNSERTDAKPDTILVLDFPSDGNNERLQRSGESHQRRTAPDVDASKAALASASGIRREAATQSSLGHSIFGWPLLLVWGLGLMATLLPLGVGLSRVALLCGRSQQLNRGSWESLLSEMCGLMRLRQSVRLLNSESTVGPLAGGIVRPFVLLPGNSDEWSPERRRMVLLHELAHIKRCDVFSQWLTRIICGVYWFHPLVWYAARQLRIERERACDDLVLQSGMTAADYSEQLVEIAFAYRSPHWVSCSAMTMARPGQLEDRVRCVLDHTRTRGRVPFPVLVLFMVAGLLCTTTIATAGKVIVRDAEGKIVAEIAIPEGGSVVIEDSQKQISQPIAGQYLKQDSSDPKEMRPPVNDWPMWGGTTHRNNVSTATNLPTDWDIEKGTNSLWSTTLGSETWGGIVVAGDKVFVGTNNGNAFVERFPKSTDLGCLICLDRTTGQFRWQHSNPKLSTGRVHDWPMQGIISTPCVEGSRLWYVTNCGEVVCLDTEGFDDGENDGPFLEEEVAAKPEADIVWKLDMMRELGVSPHNVSACSPITDGSRIFIITGHGVNESHVDPPAPNVPDVICLDRKTGKVLWQDASAAERTLHGSWSSPTFGIINGQPIVLMGLGDGWVYAYDPAGDGNGNSKLLWKFDCNAKDAKWMLGNTAAVPRNSYIATPVIWENKVYLRNGEDPEHGEGNGDLWCIDPVKYLDGGDVSATLVYAGDAKGLPVGDPLPPRRRQNFDRAAGEVEVPNPKSAVLWRYEQQDVDGNGKFEFEETLKRGLGSPAMEDGLLLITSLSGIVSCLDARTGHCHWNHDLLAGCWGSPLIADGKVYVGDEDGDIMIFELSRKKNLIHETTLDGSAYCTPVACGNTLFLLENSRLHAISTAAENATGADSTSIQIEKQ